MSRVVNFFVGRALPTCCGNVIGRDVFSALLYFARDGQQCLHLVGDWSYRVVPFDLTDQFIVRGTAAEMLCRRRAVAALAIVAIVLRGDIGGDHLAFRRGQGVRAVQ